MILLYLLTIVFFGLIFVVLLALRTLKDQQAVIRARHRLQLGEHRVSDSRPGKDRLSSLLQVVRTPSFMDPFLDEYDVLQAGLRYTRSQYLALWWLFILGGILLAAGVMIRGSLSVPGMLLGTALILLPAVVPYLFLEWRIRERERAIARELPDFLDILTFTVEAGLGFVPALRRVCDGYSSLLGQELSRVLVRMELGFSKRQALEELKIRLPSSDVEHFVEAIILSEQLGTSLARTLRVQANLLRTRRRQRAEAKAQTAPIRIIPALVFFFLPSLLLVYLAPPIINFLFR